MQLTNKKKSIANFREQWLGDFFETGKGHKKILSTMANALARKLDIINAAVSYKDLRSSQGNRFELWLSLEEYYSIRVNGQYRLIFKWVDGKATDVYLGGHTYKATR